jgi:homoserine kinase
VIAVRVPASSANLGAGFDVLGMALSIYATVGCGRPPEPALIADERHPAAVAFRRLGGGGPIWVHSPIPMARGLGYSGAVRVGGAAAAVVQRDGHLSETGRYEVLAATAELEHHADNVGASIFGGVVAAVDDDGSYTVTRLPCGFAPADVPTVIAWVPDSSTTSTDRSRSTLPTVVSRADAVFNIGRVATFVAGWTGGDVEALRLGSQDRVHQAHRLERVPESAAVLHAALAAGAWAAWLSGSGPTIVALCSSADAEQIAAALPVSGHTKVLAIDTAGATVEPSNEQ